MKLPNWIKILWWILLTIFTGWVVYRRLDSILAGTAVAFDIFIFLIFVALLLVPIFSEVELFGIRLKQEIVELKKEVSGKLADLRNEIRTTQVQTIHNTIQGLGPPPPDERLPELSKEIDRIVKARLQEHGIEAVKKPDHLDVPKDNLEMFKVRYNIENELRRIWRSRFEQDANYDVKSRQPIIRVINDLTARAYLHENFPGILREILSICNYAIHGEPLSENQIHFVETNAVGVIDYLRQLK